MNTNIYNELNEPSQEYIDRYNDILNKNNYLNFQVHKLKSYNYQFKLSNDNLLATNTNLLNQLNKKDESLSILNKNSENKNPETKNPETKNPETKNPEIQENKYKIRTYKPIKNISYSYKQVNTLLSTIRSINDIIALNNTWEKLRHNYILQRLYFLIPPLILLDKMVGLDDIKKDIFKKIIYYVMNPFKNEYLHTMISGPPGVGKSEFAKIYADIFVRLGILKTTNFIEIKRDDLIGQYLGQTSHRTKELLERAIGGVLFLDEAYSLGSKDINDSYSKEAINMINQYLSERKGEFMFIIAGYEDDLEHCLFSHNKGLKRRFQSFYSISGYTSSELYEIFKKMINNTPFKIDIDNDKLNKFFVENKTEFKYYAGDIEKLVNELKYCQSLRTFFANIKNKNIIYEDLVLALKNIKTTQNENKIPFGMYI